jgi:hypothetical protein
MPWLTDPNGNAAWVDEGAVPWWDMPQPATPQPAQPQMPDPAHLWQTLPPLDTNDWVSVTGRVKKEKKVVEKIDPSKLAECHNCGGLYDKDKMPYFNEGLKMRICASCLPRATTCGYCGDVKDTAAWNPLTPINRQCDGCGSPSSGLAVKQHRTFKPQSNVLKTRRDSLWPKKPQSQPSPWDSVPTPKSLSF